MATATRYRDLQRPVIISPVDVSSGADQAAQQLADVFTDFSRRAADIGGTLRAQQGSREGEAAGATGAPQPRRGMRATTAYGQAYNSAAEAAYSSKMQIDIESTVARLEQDHEADLEGFGAAAKGFSDELVKNVPPEYRVRIEQMLGARVAAGAIRVREQQIAKDREQQRADVVAGMQARAKTAIAGALILPRDQGDAALLASVEDNALQLEALVADNVIDASTALKWGDAYKKMLDEGLFEARTDGYVDNMMALAGADILKGDAQLAALEADSTLPDADKQAIRDKYDAARTKLVEDRSRIHVEATVALAKRLAADEFGPGVEGEARRLYRAGGMSPAEYRAAITKAQENAMRHREDNAMEAAVFAALEGGRGLDPADPKQRKALNVVVDRLVKQTNMAPGDERWTQVMVDVARRTNILPDQAESYARVNMLSGDPLQAALGAAFFDRVKDANPVAWDYNDDPNLASFATQMHQSVAAGIDPGRAYELAQRNVYGLTEDQKSILRTQYTTNRKHLEDNREALQDALDDDPKFDPSVWVSSPDATLAMRGEYDGLVAQFYVSTNGDIDTARKLASTAVRSRYGVTEMNGVREIVKFAPELMYPGLTPDIIRADLTEALKTAQSEVDPMKARIVPSPDTERTRGQVWNVAVFDEDGNYDIVRDAKGRPLPYALPLGNDFERLRQAALEREVGEARAARDRIRQWEEMFDDTVPFEDRAGDVWRR